MQQGDEIATWQILAIVAVAFPVFFVGLWTAVIWMISVIGGWREVAAHYPAERPPEGRRFTGISAMFGVANYSNLLTVVVAREGLYLAPPMFFKIGHRPLLIPWSAIRNATETVVFWSAAVSFDVGEPRLARVRLPARVFEGTPVVTR